MDWEGSSPRLVGVVHLGALPGAPGYSGSMEEVLDAVDADVRAYADGGADAVIVENFGDVPFTPGRVGPETVAAMALAGAVAGECCDLPLGFNVLRNDVRAALGLAAACGGRFVRVNVHCGVAVTDQGLIEGEAGATLRRRAALCPGVAIWADVHVKHASPLGGASLSRMAVETVERALADALIVSGEATGGATRIEDLEEVRAACPSVRLFVGSGVDVNSVAGLMEFADGVIVGSSLKSGGAPGARVEKDRVARLRQAME